MVWLIAISVGIGVGVFCIPLMTNKLPILNSIKFCFALFLLVLVIPILTQRAMAIGPAERVGETWYGDRKYEVFCDNEKYFVLDTEEWDITKIQYRNYVESIEITPECDCGAERSISITLDK